MINKQKMHVHTFVEISTVDGTQIKLLKTVPGKNHFYLSLSGSKNKLTIRKPLRENSVSGQPEVELFKGGGGFRR